MGSSRGQDASLGTGLSLPQWMKGRMDNRYDFDQSSFSPPSHDDSFFYIRYAKSNETSGVSGAGKQQAAGYRPIGQVLSEKTIDTSGSSVVGRTTVAGVESGKSENRTGLSSNVKDVKSIDFSKHPLPCQPFVPASPGGQETKSVAPKNVNKLRSAKSQGTDDGFHGEPALCGKSIVNVANRIMSKKLMKIDGPVETTDSKVQMDKHNREDDFLRKGSSKSLPVTPIASPNATPDTSPKSRRKTHANRYFTGPFVPDRDKYQSGWLLSSILGQSREMTASRIQEEDEDGPSFDYLPANFLNRKKSISSQNLSYLGKEDGKKIVSSTSSTVAATTSQYSEETQKIQQQQQEQQQQQGSKQTTNVYKNVFKAKPSELREMNFWSPTSM